MSYAIRIDGLGWRSVNGPSDCEPGEVWGANPPSSTAPMTDQVTEPPRLSSQQITKLATFFATNPDIAEAFGIKTP